ncbi:MAG: molybdate transporter permease subunit [Pseudomonadota bacterium]|jgi:molybdate transport system permease protein
MVSPYAAILLSMQVAVVATALGLPAAMGVAWVLARRRFPGKALLAALVSAPLVLPPVVTGLVLLRVFGRTGPFGAWLDALGVPVVFSWLGAMVAALVVGFPLFVLTLRAAFETVDPRYEDVSRTLGVPPAATWRRITLPLAGPGVLAAISLAFARALGEFGATAVLAGNTEGRTRTIALAVYTLLETPDGEGRIRLLVGASMVLSLGALAAFEVLVRRQRRRLELDDA